jgi:hypothetical protein
MFHTRLLLRTFSICVIGARVPRCFTEGGHVFARRPHLFLSSLLIVRFSHSLTIYSTLYFYLHDPSSRVPRALPTWTFRYEFRAVTSLRVGVASGHAFSFDRRLKILLIPNRLQFLSS